MESFIQRLTQSIGTSCCERLVRLCSTVVTEFGFLSLNAIQSTVILELGLKALLFTDLSLLLLFCLPPPFVCHHFCSEFVSPSD